MNLTVELDQVVTVNWADRWQVYHRLQELQIPCQCHVNQPLKVKLNNPTDAIQLWSVVKQFSASRDVLVQWLDSCWQLD